MEIIRSIILWGLLPAWVAAGTLDWLCHRRANIAVHCGPWESVLHLLLLAEAGTALLIGLLLELNEPALTLISILFVVHEGTAYIDTRYAHARRDISPLEQKVHDYMTAIPVTVLVLVGLLYADVLAAMIADPARIYSQPLLWKRNPLPLEQVLAILGLVTAANLIPYAEELVRGWRARSLPADLVPGCQQGSRPRSRTEPPATN
jgi:hypothetical protein